MDTNCMMITVILLVLMVAQGSDAASLLSRVREMLAVASEVNGTQISPSPAPISETKSNQHVDLGTSGTEQPLKSNNSSKVDQMGSSVKGPEMPQNETHVDGDLNQQLVHENCNASGNTCKREKMVACLKHSGKGSQDLIILIQNEGESALNVSITVPVSVEVSTKELQIPQHQVKKINVSTKSAESPKIVLKAGYEECVLYTKVPVSDGTFFRSINSYANQVTPMHGAYFTFLVVLVVGGTWACCMIRKKGQRGNGGVPYEELEMTVPESVSAVNVDAEEGWDEGWGDDWDEERAVKSPGKPVGSVSANGLTSRSPNREGWENDWDD